MINLKDKIFANKDKTMSMINSKWRHKDGGIYTIVKITEFELVDGTETLLIEYSDHNDTIYIRTKEHFESSFTNLTEE